MERVEETRKRVLEQAASRMEDVPCERRRHWIRRGRECGECYYKEERERRCRAEETRNKILSITSRGECIACPRNIHWIRSGETCAECELEEGRERMQSRRKDQKVGVCEMATVHI